MRRNDLFTLMIDEFLDYLECMLHCTGTIDRDPRSSPYEKHQKDADNENLHGEKVRDRRSRIVGEKILAFFAGLNRMCSERRQNARSDSGKVSVQKVSKEQFFCHSGIKLRFRSVTATPGSV